ncbi:hypothetical protein [Lutibaculum baratangense]|uniref:Secreted protein n=1 Tax=Lutibaculum baratangense AMV1 TaxID=631454 RepID=V4RGU6_9HYPH|nr:hypothetical protein [Lutibaculum baratangense]ESR22510.1 hypothetical protein N177_4075 [Lutibaculum baratangense AMV1]
MTNHTAIAGAATAALLLVAIGTGHASAQEAFPACQSQQELEQVIGSDGQFMPDGCRNLTITAVETDGARLCVIDFATAGEGVLNTLRDAALPEQWWVRCDRLEAEVR